MSETFSVPLDPVGEAALLCYRAQGKEYSKATVLVLKELHIAFKARNQSACKALIKEVNARYDFPAEAP